MNKEETFKPLSLEEALQLAEQVPEWERRYDEHYEGMLIIEGQEYIVHVIDNSSHIPEHSRYIGVEILRKDSEGRRTEGRKIISYRGIDASLKEVYSKIASSVIKTQREKQISEDIPHLERIRRFLAEGNT